MEHPQFSGDRKWVDQKILHVKDGLDPKSSHTIKIVHTGKGNPFRKAAWVTIDGFIVK